MKGLKGKVAIVTGGAASIGAAISRALHNEGVKVVIAARTAANGEALSAELGDNAVFQQTDITDDQSLDALVDRAVEEFGGIDILVNNACSYGDSGPDSSRDEWLETLNVNLISSAILGQKARPHLALNKGTIVNIGSISGHAPQTGRWTYPVSKAAAGHLTRSQAVDYAPDGIRVNTLSLGMTWSDPFEGVTGNDRKHADNVASEFCLMGRVANAEEAADGVLFLCSDRSSYITGTDLAVDGGYTAMGVEQAKPLFPMLSKEV